MAKQGPMQQLKPLSSWLVPEKKVFCVVMGSLSKFTGQFTLFDNRGTDLCIGPLVRKVSLTKGAILR